MAQPHAVYFSPDATTPPEYLRGWFESRALGMVVCQRVDDLMAMALRGRPSVVVFDARTVPDAALTACRRLKGDPYTGVVPGGVLAADGGAALAAAFQAGADEVLLPGTPGDEAVLRLDVMLRRADRDVHVHPSTRLPGAPEIEAEIGRRLAAGETFAACYADLDHFKEYNDRYSYYEGDRVIRILAKILHDVARGYCPEDGFVGHIGGDDFISHRAGALGAGDLPGDRLDLRCARAVPVFRTGPFGWIFLREGPARPAASRAADDGFDRGGDE